MTFHRIHQTLGDKKKLSSKSQSHKSSQDFEQERRRDLGLLGCGGGGGEELGEAKAGGRDGRVCGREARRRPSCGTISTEERNFFN